MNKNTFSYLDRYYLGTDSLSVLFSWGIVTEFSTLSSHTYLYREAFWVSWTYMLLHNWFSAVLIMQIRYLELDYRTLTEQREKLADV